MKRSRMSSTAAVFIILTIAFALGVYQGLAQVHDVAVTNITKSKSIVGQGFSMQINVTAANLGGSSETFNITLNGTRLVVGTVSIHLYGSATQGWGFIPSAITSPGPTLAFHKGDLVNLTLTSQDGAPHQFYVDYNGDHSPSPGEPTSPVFTATINYQFTVDTLGAFTYYCSIHPLVMFGTFTVTTPPTQTTQIGKQLVSVNPGASVLVAFIWNTMGYPKGNYTITAIADPVSGETNTTNNTFTDNWVVVAMVGDVSGPAGVPDGKVDIRDLAAMAKVFGINYPDPRYNPNYDITGPTPGVADGKIDIRDLATAAKNFGKVDP